MGELSPWHWAIVIIVLVVLFGARRLPDAARSLGRSARILKSELRATDAEAPAATTVPTAPTAPQAEPPATSSTPESSDSSVTTPHTTPRQN
jgi:sec-independent protein translocase protein TatA